MRPAFHVAWLALALMVSVGRVDTSAQLLQCNISTSGVAFGSYSVFGSSPTDSSGTITYSCTLGVLIRIELGTGSAGTFNPRTMTKGADTLNYNLFLDSARQTIWGDGTSGTSRFTDALATIFPETVTVYGRVSALQDAAAGNYSDSVVATIVY